MSESATSTSEVADRVDQLAELGQRVIDAVVSSYDPDGTSTLALALHPGQAIADDIVQGGVTNPLRLSTWLSDQYDYPMHLKIADGTPVASTALGGVTATSAYVTMARWAQPAMSPDAPAFARIAQLIADARQDLGTDPDNLPLACEPTDFAEPGCTAWKSFDTAITTHAEETTIQTPPRTAGFNPKLWRLRALPTATLDALPQRQLALQESRIAFRELAVDRTATFKPNLSVLAAKPGLAYSVARTRFRPTATVEAGTMHAESLSDSYVARPATARMQVASAVRDSATVTRSLSLGQLARFETEPPASDRPVRVLEAPILAQLAHVQLADLEPAPSEASMTAQDSELRVHFEYLVVTVTRRLAGIRWWHPELLQEPSLYVSAMTRGAMVPPSEDADYAWCLPVSLLLVRNVSLTGTWSQEARDTMSSTVHYVGPFLMAPMQETTAAASSELQQTTVVGTGIQVIGELCSPLPALPPMDDPTAVPAG